jgi:hypothetical protein
MSMVYECTPPPLLTTVASLPIILQNNSKPAEKKKEIGRENWRPCGRHFSTKAAENRPKKIFNEQHSFY